VLFYLGNIALLKKDIPQAARLLRESLQHVPGSEVALNMLGTLECYQGHYDRAAALCEEALTEFRQQHWAHGIATVLHSLGNIALFQGDAMHARARFIESLRLWSENGNKLRSRRHKAVHRGLSRAVTLWTATDAIRASMGSVSPALRHRDYRALVDGAQARLDGRAQIAAVKTGGAMGFEQAVTFALSQDDLAM
jgi:tetratricopeptide (TPR) repeat protein